jgi:hypothetical protein
MSKFFHEPLATEIVVLFITTISLWLLILSIHVLGEYVTTFLL